MRTCPRRAVLAALVIVPVLSGCAVPAVDIRHVLPAAVPLPSDLVKIEAGDFEVQGGEGDLAAFTRQALQQRLAEAWRPAEPGQSSATLPSASVAEVGGTIHVQTSDVKGTREVRVWQGQTGQLEVREVPTLVRTAAVTVEFVIRSAGQDEPLATIETRRTYDSLGDPRLRGELGLDRPDDPNNAPPAGTIIRELLGECVDAFCGMIAPLEVTDRVQMRLSLRSDAIAGLEAAAKGDFKASLEHFRSAVAASPSDVNLLFDLAVAAEAAGELAVAAEHYGRAAELTGNKDQAAADGALRVKRVLRHLQQPGR